MVELVNLVVHDKLHQALSVNKFYPNRCAVQNSQSTVVFQPKCSTATCQSFYAKFLDSAVATLHNSFSTNALSQI